MRHVGARSPLRLTPEARDALRPGEALVFDYHRVPMCCAAAFEVALRRTTEQETTRNRAFVRLTDPTGPPVFAHRRALPHLIDLPVEIGVGRILGMRRFHSDLPPDFGLRISLGQTAAAAPPPLPPEPRPVPEPATAGGRS